MERKIQPFNDVSNMSINTTTYWVNTLINGLLDSNLDHNFLNVYLTNVMDVFQTLITSKWRSVRVI